MRNIKKYLAGAGLLFAIAACNNQESNPTGQPVADPTVDTRSSAAVPGGAGNTDSTPAAWLISPGKSIGQVALLESAEEVHEKLGTPDGGDAAMGKSISTWYADHDSLKHVTQIYFSRGQGDDEIKRAKQIRVTSPSFRLSSGITIGADVNSLTGFQFVRTATFTEHGGQRTLYDDANAGIALDVDAKSHITGITVHEPGRKASGTYLPFFPDLREI